ncbi:histone-lysine N-methyltransferase SETMAR [Trichonephila clavipes]|nr:histone-lysine N-methyltransferase SETMAR [Trichonephila clavipes]
MLSHWSMRISHKCLTNWKTTFAVLLPIYGHKRWEKSSKIGRPDWTTAEPAVAVIRQKSYLKWETNGANCHTDRVGNKVPRQFRTIEMARCLGNWSRLEVRAMIQFLWSKNVSASNIQSQIVEIYGEEAMSRQHIAKWHHSFQSGRQDVENRNMAGNGCPSSLTTEEMMQND